MQVLGVFLCIPMAAHEAFLCIWLLNVAACYDRLYLRSYAPLHVSRMTLCLILYK